MKKYKSIVLFLSSSTKIYNAIPNEIFENWDIYFSKTYNDRPLINKSLIPQLIILDTYNLGFDFLFLLKQISEIDKCPILVIDEYDQEVLINTIIKNGASSYIQLSEISQHLENKIKNLLPTNH
ncbi:MAG: hypothetical protein OEX22_08040 [Cyclobacteriaceae bacterium]|nr:hypothetical protein [Cyclobacteriaceae bacterium]